MTSRERVRAALEHREPDRTPIFEYVLLSPLADTFLARPYAGDPANQPAMLAELGWRETVRRAARDQVELACLLGHDMIYAVPGPLPPAAAQPRTDKTVLRPPDDPVERVEARNVSAAAQVRSPADEMFAIYESLHEEMRLHDVDFPLLAPAYAHGVWTDTDLMQTMVLAPEVAHTHFRLATERTLRLIDRYVELGVDQIGVGGDFAGNRPLISPSAYREFIVPEVRRLSRRVHEVGGWAINASDGNLWSVIDDFLLGCEVDGYLEIDLHAGMTLDRLKREFGQRITFYGNLDCGNTLSFADSDGVRRHVIECLEAGLGGGGHILCASNAITASVPHRNYLALVNAYRDFFGLPRLAL